MQSKAWPYEEARKLLKRGLKAGGEPIVFETGYGPSGLPHIGTFNEVLRTTFVRHAFHELTGGADLNATIEQSVRRARHVLAVFSIEALGSAIKLARAGLREPEKPIGNYLFTGPTGVGKTETARAMVAPGKGLLAADESAGTCKKRFDSVSVECNEDNRRAYREMLFTTPEIALMMSLVVVAGAVLQLPVGRISDITDRRYVLAAAAVGAALFAPSGGTRRHPAAHWPW